MENNTDEEKKRERMRDRKKETERRNIWDHALFLGPQGI